MPTNSMADEAGETRAYVLIRSGQIWRGRLHPGRFENLGVGHDPESHGSCSPQQAGDSASMCPKNSLRSEFDHFNADAVSIALPPASRSAGDNVSNNREFVDGPPTGTYRQLRTVGLKSLRRIKVDERLDWAFDTIDLWRPSSAGAPPRLTRIEIEADLLGFTVRQLDPRLDAQTTASVFLVSLDEAILEAGRLVHERLAEGYVASTGVLE